MTDLAELIRKKGTIEGLMALQKNSNLTQNEMRERMGVANGTIQRRIEEMKSKNLIEEDATLADSGRPMKTYKLTHDGSERASKLRELLEE